MNAMKGTSTQSVVIILDESLSRLGLPSRPALTRLIMASLQGSTQANCKLWLNQMQHG